MRGAVTVYGWLATGAAVTDPRLLELSRTLGHRVTAEPTTPKPSKSRKPDLCEFVLPAAILGPLDALNARNRRIRYLVETRKTIELAREFPELKKRRKHE